jgi:hypothetical protein
MTGSSGRVFFFLWFSLGVCGLDTSIQGGRRPVGPNSFDDADILQTSSSGPIRLEHLPVRVALRSPRGKKEKLSEQLLHLASRRRIYLLVRGLRCESQPGVTYHLYLDLLEGISPSADDLRRVGTVNFFSASSSGRAVSDESESWRSFEVTALIEKLASRGLLSEATSITIAVFQEPEANSSPSIGSVALVAQ